MYKIYNNEIKIKQILKGGGIYDETIGGAFGESSSFDPHPIETQIYKLAKPGVAFDLNETILEKENSLNLLRPLYGTEIRYTNFDLEMYTAIIYTLIIFSKLVTGYKPKTGSKFNVADKNFYSKGLLNAYDPRNETHVNVSKNYFTLGIAVLKQLGLYDHETDDFIDYDDFKDKVIGKPTPYNRFDLTSSSEDNWDNFFTVNSKNDAKNAFANLLETDVDLIETDDSSAKAESNGIKESYKKIFKYLKLDGPVSDSDIKIFDADIIPFKKFVEIMRRLKVMHSKTISCKPIYFKLFKPKADVEVNNQLLFARYGHFGGAINNLDYMLNGGSVNSLIRIPDLSSYFRAQLDIAKQKLKNKSKSLSVSSENEILQIIEALEKHEKNLKEQFELLKNAHLIDEKVVSLRDDRAKLEKAKSSLRKYMKYNNGLYDIVRNILEITDEIKGKSLPTKPAFEG